MSRNADEVVIEAAYKALVKEHHPDQGGDKEEFQRIKEAYDKIQNNDTQRTYDRNGASFNGFVKGLRGLGTPVSSESIEGTLDEDLVLEQGPVRVSLLGLFRTDISALVWDHKEDEIVTSDRFLCLFRIENLSEYVQPWMGSSDTSFTGSDGQTYSAAEPTLLAQHGHSPLSSQFSIDREELEPGTWTLGVLAVEPLPDGVDISRVVYNHKVFEGHQTDGWVKEKLRFEFNITDEKRKHMLALIAQELMDEPPTNTPLGKLKEPSETQILNNPTLDNRQTDTQSKDNESTTSKRSTTEMSDEKVSRTSDIINLQPTSNGELADAWGFSTGKEAFQYLSNNLDEFYYRDEDSYIRATEEAEKLMPENKR